MRYNEELTLKYLMKQIDLVVGCNADALDEDIEPEDEDNYFTITVGGKTFTFVLGGPQVSALTLFIEWIAYENMHDMGTPWLDNLDKVIRTIKGGE